MMSRFAPLNIPTPTNAVDTGPSVQNKSWHTQGIAVTTPRRRRSRGNKAADDNSRGTMESAPLLAGTFIYFDGGTLHRDPAATSLTCHPALVCYKLQ